jgi:hypothetical protein
MADSNKETHILLIIYAFLLVFYTVLKTFYDHPPFMKHETCDSYLFTESFKISSISFPAAAFAAASV